MGRPTPRRCSKSARESLQERKRGERARPPSYLMQTLPFSYAAISTRVYPSHPNREYKLVRARVVLRWGTTREGRVLHIFVLFCCAGGGAGPTGLASVAQRRILAAGRSAAAPHRRAAHDAAFARPTASSSLRKSASRWTAALRTRSTSRSPPVQLSDGGRLSPPSCPPLRARALGVLKSASIITPLPSALCLPLAAAHRRRHPPRAFLRAAAASSARDRAGPPRSTATLPRTNFFIRLCRRCSRSPRRSSSSTPSSPLLPPPAPPPPPPPPSGPPSSPCAPPCRRLPHRGRAARR